MWYKIWRRNSWEIQPWRTPQTSSTANRLSWRRARLGRIWWAKSWKSHLICLILEMDPLNSVGARIKGSWTNLCQFWMWHPELSRPQNLSPRRTKTRTMWLTCKLSLPLTLWVRLSNYLARIRQEKKSQTGATLQEGGMKGSLMRWNLRACVWNPHTEEQAKVELTKPRKNYRGQRKNILALRTGCMRTAPQPSEKKALRMGSSKHSLREVWMRRTTRKWLQQTLKTRTRKERTRDEP